MRGKQGVELVLVTVAVAGIVAAAGWVLMTTVVRALLELQT